MLRRMTLFVLTGLTLASLDPSAQKYTAADGHIRVALTKQPFSPTGLSKGPATMAEGGIQKTLADLGATIRVAGSTPHAGRRQGVRRLEASRLRARALRRPGRAERARRLPDRRVARHLSRRCPGSSPDSNTPDRRLEPLRVGMLWLDAHPDFNTPETTRSGSLGGMPVAVATGRALQGMRLDAKLDPPLSDRQVVMGGVRLTDPLEQQLLDESRIQQLTVDDLRTASAAVFAQLDRLNGISDKLYVHIDMDVLDPREVMGHGNKVPGGPSSEELARLFEEIFRRYPKASAIGFATIPPVDEGGLSIAAVNRMIAAAVRGVRARERGGG